MIIISYYYGYTLGYKTKDDKIYPLGPFDHNGELVNVVYKSRSFASDLYEDFYPIKDGQWTEPLKKQFTYTDYKNEKHLREIKVLPISALPKGSYIKRGYFLIDDIDRYTRMMEGEDIYFEEFYDYLSVETYLRKLENEIKFGKPQPYKDCEGEEIIPHSCADYAYFCYPDYSSREYESYLLRNAENMFYTYKLPEGSKIMVLETEG